jgi:sortase (surface protein transpeptidase)
LGGIFFERWKKIKRIKVVEKCLEEEKFRTKILEEKIMNQENFGRKNQEKSFYPRRRQIDRVVASDRVTANSTSRPNTPWNF